jgi:hypothetical protein
MLAGGLDPFYRQLLANPHEQISYVQVWRGGFRLDDLGPEGLPFVSCSVGCTLTSQVSRQLSLTTWEDFWPTDPYDPEQLLTPWGNEIRAWCGVSSGAGAPVYIWQVFRGQIQAVELDTSGNVNVDCIDRAGAVKEAGFLKPENSQVNDPVVDEFRRLVTDGLDDATFGTFDDIATLTPQLTWEEDRAGACDDLANAAGSLWYPLANGDFVMRFVPWAIDQDSLLTLSDGPGGVLVTAAPQLSRENVFNQYTVTGERANSDVPVFATARDIDPTSVTFIDGPFGVRAKTLSLQGTVTQSQALSVAKTALRQGRALGQVWTVTMPTDAALELGDVVTIDARGLPPVKQVVATMSLSLAGDQMMSIGFRALQPGSTTASEG